MTVHVRIDDLAQPIDSSFFQAVADCYAGIGISLDIQWGSFDKTELQIQGNIQITTLTSNFNAEDQKIAESAIRELWVTPPGVKHATADDVVADTISQLRDPNIRGITAGVAEVDPLRSPILIKAPPDNWPTNEVFLKAYGNNSVESNKARDLYYYTDVIIHEIGHAFGIINHNSVDPLDFMYSSPSGQQIEDKLMEGILSEAPKDDLANWQEWVKKQIALRRRHFSDDEAEIARNTVSKFVK